MTEADWISCSDSLKMLAFLCDNGKVSHRKARLFAVACCRRIWPLLTDGRSRKAVERSEQFADDHASGEEMLMSLKDAIEAAESVPAPADAAETACFEDAVSDLGVNGAAGAAADSAAHAASVIPYRADVRLWDHDPATLSVERMEQCRLLREIVGNPLRPVAVDPDWLTAKVVTLAETAYDDRDLPSGHLRPDHLTRLAAALAEAGCTDAELLAHLRSEGPHYRGCWGLDLLLGKE